MAFIKPFPEKKGICVHKYKNNNIYVQYTIIMHVLTLSIGELLYFLVNHDILPHELQHHILQSIPFKNR